MFHTVTNADAGKHTFRTMMPVDLSQLIAAARERYTQIRCDTRLSLEDVSLAGIDILSVERIRQFIDNATLPPRTQGNFDVVRADFGEILSILALENEFETKLCWIGVRDRERSDMPGRGLDVVGVEDSSQLCLVLCEAKVSDEYGRIPQVVDQNDDSLSKQLRKHMTEHERTSSRLWEAVRRAADRSAFTSMIRATFFWDKKDWSQLRVICCAFLVRPVEKYNERDFGHLKQYPQKVAPGCVRFVILCLDDDIHNLVDSFGQNN